MNEHLQEHADYHKKGWQIMNTTPSLTEDKLTSLIQQVKKMKKKNPDVIFEDGLRKEIYHSDRDYYNQACDDFIELLQSQTEKGEAHER